MQLAIQNLSKTYANGVRALQAVSLTIPTGMFGLLGPNGAGKSTLMRTLATLQEADAGTVFLDELNVLEQQGEIRKVLGYLPQEFGFYPRIRAVTLLDHFARLKGLTERRARQDVVEALLHRVNLWDARKRRIGEYSGGMKQRFGIAQALLGDPRLIIVDEPTAGLDPAERRRFHNLLSEIGENVIVILSTHIVEDVSDLCTRMAIINQGRILLTGSPHDLMAEMEGKIWKHTIDKAALPEYEARFDVISTRLFAGQTILHVYSEDRPDPAFMPAETSLEDVYFHHLRLN